MWVVYNEFPFGGYRLYRNKPTLCKKSGLNSDIKFVQPLIYWNHEIEGSGLEISVDAVRLIVGEEGVKRLLLQEAIEVITVPMDGERRGIKPPEDPKELEIFKRGLCYAWDDE